MSTGFISRKQIAIHMGEESGWVAGRCNSLKKKMVIEENPIITRCPLTGKSVHMVRLT